VTIQPGLAFSRHSLRPASAGGRSRKRRRPASIVRPPRKIRLVRGHYRRVDSRQLSLVDVFQCPYLGHTSKDTRLHPWPSAPSGSSAAAMRQASVAESSVMLPPVRRERYMATADEYRQFAEECFRWARDAKTDADRKAFLDIARAWTQAAPRGNGEADPTIIMAPEDASHRAASMRPKPPK
jgi:hypothetical protein